MVDRLVSCPLHIERVSKSYGAFLGLRDVSLEVRGGEFLTLLGPSGSGKTTLLMTIAGFTKADSGSLRFGDSEMIDTPPHKRNIGVVFQNYALFPHMNVGRNVGYPLKLRGVGRAEMEKRVMDALRLVKLEGMADRKPDALSGGQRQRVAIARAIIFEPRILLMDEPLSALDKNLREAMQIEIRRLHDRLGVMTLYVTHDQREALTMSDRIAVMNEGMLAQIGTPREIYDAPQTSFVGTFIGESLLVPLTRRDGTLLLDGVPLAAPGSAMATQATRPHLLVRPERLALAATLQPGINTLAARLCGTIYQGDSVLVQIALESGAEIGLRVGARDPQLAALPPPGGRLTVGLAADDVIIVDDR